MKTRFLLLIVVVFFGFLEIPLSFSEDFNFKHFDDNEYVYSYQIVNGNLINLDLTSSDSILFAINGTNGNLVLEIPKSIPLDYYSGHISEQDNFILMNGEEIDYETIISDCFIEQTIPFKGKSEIEIIYGHIIAGPRLSYVDLPDICLEDSRNNNDVQNTLNEKQCSSTGYHKGINIRDEAVCITIESYPWLNQRGYLKTFPILQ